jgi:hypothetical protein
MLARVAAVLSALLPACRGPSPSPLADAAQSQLLRTVLPPETRLLVRPLPVGPVTDEALAGIDALVIGGRGWRVPDLHGPQALAVVRRFVERGGRVLLLGYAVALVHDLGLEARPPDLVEPFRWGFDARTAEGRARLGFQLVSGRMPELVDGMQHAPAREHAYFLTGGTPLSVPMCLYAAGPPEHAEVLGTIVRECDGEAALWSATVLARWQLGAGAVLGLGLEPDVTADDPIVAQNAAAFFKAALQWLGGASAPKQLGYWLLPDPTPPPLPTRLPDLAEREVPGASLLAHWGFVAAVHDDSAPRTPERVLDEVLLPSFLCGADVLALDLVDAQQGLPLPWGERDPLARPQDYRSSALARGWGGDALQRLLGEAHARGMIVQALLDPPPGGNGVPERLAALRYIGRQWCDLRRLSAARVLDGIALRDWFRDARGLGVAMLQDFQPGGHVVRIGEGLPQLAGAAGAVDAGDGRPAGLCAFGLDDGWRDGFPADLYPVGYLDCTTVRPGRGLETDAPRGGGSFGDWIAEQVRAFVRARRSAPGHAGGGAMLWRSHSDATLGPDTVAYVQGVSSEPLVAAVAARCTTIGQDGWRDAQQALLPGVQRGFGASLPVPAATVMLANNHLRLCGSGGSLSFDTGGLGRFDGPGSVHLCDSFFRTRFFGGRPDADELRTAAIDLLAGGRRGDGGYPRVYPVMPAGSVPATLAFDAAPKWPQRLDMMLGERLGRFELQIEARPIAGQGVVAVGVDDDVLVLLPFQDGRLSIRRTLPIDLARTGHRTLRLEVLDGGAVTFDRLQLRRVGDVAAEAEVAVPAGGLAIARERSASTYHQETVELRLLADFPGLLLRADTERAVRSLQQERRFGLLHHRKLLLSTAGEAAGELRRPFVLAADQPSLPDLAVVPLRLARYEYFRIDDGELVLRNQPEPGTSSAVGFAWLQHGASASTLVHLQKVFAALDRPTVLDLAAGGAAELRSDLALPWTRVVGVQQDSRTPFLVRENGWWTWRPAQPGALPGGGDLLRVHHLPGDVVQILGGQALLARTRPGPGALHTVALRDPTSTAVTARVLQSSPLVRPSVTMGADFDEVLVNGKPWALFDGRTVGLPNRAGDYTVTTHQHGGGPSPHVVATRAPLEHCAFEPATHTLVLVVEADAARPPELPFAAVLAGPPPLGIDGGEIVGDQEFCYADAATRAAAASAGTVIRFRPGIVRVRYGP